MSVEELRARYEHCEKRAEQLEEKWENGERMNGTVIQMMKRYRQLADAYFTVLEDVKRTRRIT